MQTGFSIGPYLLLLLFLMFKVRFERVFSEVQRKNKLVLPRYHFSVYFENKVSLNQFTNLSNLYRLE